MIYRKLEFPVTFDWKALMAECGLVLPQQSSEGDIESTPPNAIIYDLGHIVLKPEVLDAEGEVITEPVLSVGYCVDIMCEELPTELTPYIVWPSNIGKHIPMGWEEYYQNQRNELHL
jgi:hypothetical protein